MIIEFISEEELRQKLTEGYIEELKAYCEAKGYTKEQTKKFIQNTLKTEEKNRLAQLGE